MSHVASMDQYVIKFLNSKKSIMGSGFWVLPEGYGVTCYHVIAKESRQSLDSVRVEFNRHILHVKYEPDLSDPAQDIAVFRLIDNWDGPLPFVSLGRVKKLDIRIRIFGYRDGLPGGYQLTGELQPGQHAKVGALYNLATSMPDKSSIAGMSGAPVFEADSGKVVGLLYAEEEMGPAVSYVHPVDKLYGAWPELAFRNQSAVEALSLTLAPESPELSEALKEHHRYQRRLFEEAPVLGKSPFALQDIYIDMHCGHLKWKEINHAGQSLLSGLSEADAEAKVKNPFSERDSERQSLLSTVLDLIGDTQLTEPIIIQGSAGSGKSSFTLKLCVELQRLGLYPILIRFKDIRFDLPNVADALPKAVRFSSQTRSRVGARLKSEDIFRRDDMWHENGVGAFSHICRYVLVLDGWDEISVASDSFKQRVERVLEHIRNQYVDNPEFPLPLRVIITGRPTVEVFESNFLHDETPVLTLRPLIPVQLKTFVQKLSEAVDNHPLNPEDEDVWPPFKPQQFEPFLDRYEEDFARLLRSDEADTTKTTPGTGSLGVLGLPLLSQLAVRLTAEWESGAEQLINNPTTLYRNLVDLTCSKGGKPANDTTASYEELRAQSRIYGQRLRELLWQTAEVMTMYGRDIIPYKVLAQRLALPGDALDKNVRETTEKHSLSSLLISFYFKGGFKNAGCEFAHKSFREYLFAEAIVERLKEYGRQAPTFLPERVNYWEEFGPSDPRFAFSRRLAKMLAPQWSRPEVFFHVDRLIRWEIQRATNDNLGHDDNVVVTTPVTLEEWRRIRDGLADLWCWWGEGVHLRPQGPFKGSGKGSLHDPYVTDLVNYSFNSYPDRVRLGPPRTTAMDSHLGYGLFLLCTLVHYYMAHAEAALEETQRVNVATREYQAEHYVNQRRIIMFAPSGNEPEYFTNYIHRIGSAGIRQNGWFPASADLRGVSLTRTHLVDIDFSGANLSDADLTEADLTGANLTGARLDNATLMGVILDGSNLTRAYFTKARLDSARFIGAKLIEVTFKKANLTETDFSITSLDKVDFTESILMDAGFRKARLRGVIFDEALLHRANFEMADIFKGSMAKAQLNDAILVATRFALTTFDEANLINALLDGAEFAAVDLSRTKGLTRKQITKTQIDERSSLPHLDSAN